MSEAHITAALADLSQRLPLFVYGSLRRGMHNEARLAAGEKFRAAAEVHGFALYDSGWSFPYALPAPESSRVWGELVYFTDADYVPTMRWCDRLEGFHPGDPEVSHYTRTVVRVRRVDDGRWEPAWMYVANRDLVDMDRLVPGGDWVEYREQVAVEEP